MTVMGIYLKADKLRIVTLSGTRSSHAIVCKEFDNIGVPKDNNPENVMMLRNSISAHIRTNLVAKIGVNGRNARGEHAGGPLTFKSEGFLVGISEVPVVCIFPQTTASTERKAGNLKSLRPSTVDLGKAYDLAFELLEQ